MIALQCIVLTGQPGPDCVILANASFYLFNAEAQSQCGKSTTASACQLLQPQS